MRAVLEADAPRVRCPEHGVVVAAVPWARHGAGHTRFFDDQVAWLAVTCSKTAVTELMRIAWRTVGAIVTRVAADATAGVDRFAGLRRIGIDEISYKKGHRYLTVVVDHDSRPAGVGRGRPGHAHPAAGSSTCSAPERCAADHPRVGRRGGLDRRCGRRALPERGALRGRRSTSWPGPPRPSTRSAARPGTTPARWPAPSPAAAGAAPAPTPPPRPGHDRARRLKNARYALWKNPENLTDRQADKLAWIAKTDPRLHRAYLLKEGLRYVFAVKGHAGKRGAGPVAVLGRAAAASPPSSPSAARSASTARRSTPTLDHGLSNALIESTNTKIRLLHRIAFGFHSADALIALAMLALGGFRPPLPGRA